MRQKEPPTLQSIRSRKEARRRQLDEGLAKVREQLQSMGALKIILFGSYATDHLTSRSDLDLICIMPPEKTGRQWMKKIYEEVERHVDCDILAYTRDELEKAMPVSRFLRRILEQGKTIYEKRPER